MPKTPPDLIGTVEAAPILGVKRGEVTYLVRTGQLAPHSRCPCGAGAYLFERAVVEALAAARAKP